jgi:hypothetical protein
MKRTLAVLTVGTVSSLAHGAPRATFKFTDPRGPGAAWLAPAPSGVSHIIYLDNCQPNGCTLTPGSDGTQNQSDIINSQVHMSAYSGGASNWSALVQCVKLTYQGANANVTVTDQRPPAGTAYHHAIVAGTAAEGQESQGVLGVSPFTCGYIPNAISFTFANEEPTNIDDLCWTVSQETSHSWGLDHKFDDRDPMTYLQSGPSRKAFQNQAGVCGEYSARACNCTYPNTGSAQENSVAVITATFGSGTPDTTPPTVHITSPANGAQVQMGFAITADVADDRAVTAAQLQIDGVNVGGPLTSPPWMWNAPVALGQGSHTVAIIASDGAGNHANDSVDVQDGMSCVHDTDCATAGDICQMGHCVLGPSMPGGLGTSCTMNGDCASGQCAADGSGHMYCVDPCDPTKNSCPSNFSCQAVSGGGVCWPGAANGGGGGCAAGGSSSGIALLGMLGAAMLVTRRRR